MQMLNNLHARYLEALANGRTPDFQLFEDFKQSVMSLDSEPDLEHCLDCATTLEVNKSLYIKLFINQVNVCNGNGEEINTHFSQREVFLCQKCSTNIVHFTKPANKPDNKEGK